MPKAWNAKRERQYEHIKSGAQEHGNIKGRSTMNKKELQRALGK